MNLPTLRLYLDLLRIKTKISKKFSTFKTDEDPKDMSKFTNFYRGIWKEAASINSAEFNEIAPGIWKIFKNERTTIINNYKVELDSPVVLDIAGQRSLSFKLLQESGLPVPDHLSCKYNDLKNIMYFLKKHRHDYFVVKPENSTSGASGISTHLKTLSECISAIALASIYNEKIIIEKFIAGESYRFLVLNGSVLHVSRRKGIWITGDGRSNIYQLLKKQCGSTYNLLSFKTFFKEGIKYNRDLSIQLGYQGLTLNTVLPNLKRVLVGCQSTTYNNTVEYRTVFDEDVTNNVSPLLCNQAVRAAEILNSEFAGVDIITIDHNLPLDLSGGVINEVNTTPGLHHHYNLVAERQQFPAATVLRHLLGNVDI